MITSLFTRALSSRNFLSGTRRFTSVTFTFSLRKTFGHFENTRDIFFFLSFFVCFDFCRRTDCQQAIVCTWHRRNFSSAHFRFERFFGRQCVFVQDIYDLFLNYKHLLKCHFIQFREKGNVCSSETKRFGIPRPPNCLLVRIAICHRFLTHVPIFRAFSFSRRQWNKLKSAW